MHQIVCRLGLRLRPHLGSLRRSRWFRGGVTGKGKEVGEGERERGEGWHERGREWRESQNSGVGVRLKVGDKYSED